METKVALVVVLQLSEVEKPDLLSDLAELEDGVLPLNSLGLGPVAEAILVGAVSLRSLIGTVEVLLRHLRRGVTVENRAGQIVVKGNSDLPKGSVATQKADGQIQIEMPKTITDSLTEIFTRRNQA